MRVDVVLSPLHYGTDESRAEWAVVAVDVLRATSAICAAFQAGVDAVMPLASLTELAAMADKGFVLAAERDGKKVEGAMCGNSPTEYLSMNLSGRRLAYSTTNGTVTILRAKKCARLYIGCFVNTESVAARIVSEKASDKLAILCSGWKNEPCMEDTLFAGALVEALLKQGADLSLGNDAAFMALDLWHAAMNDLYAFCRRATHVERLTHLGYDNDIRWALRMDECNVAPVFDKSVGMIVR